MPFFRWMEIQGGADAGGMGERSPRRGSIRRAGGSDRGSGRLPAGDVCARRRRRQVGAPSLFLNQVTIVILICPQSRSGRNMVEKR